MIWYRPYKIEELGFLWNNNMLDHLGIEIIELGDDYIVGKMPVDHRTIQQMKVLHGGATVALAESLGSIGCYLTLDSSRFTCMGMEINANHLRPVSSGYVYATARPIHIGKRTHVWSIETVNEEGKLVCVSRITLAVVEIAGLL